MAILQFSEIFGVHDSLKKKEKRDSRYCTRRGACPINLICGFLFQVLLILSQSGMILLH